MATHAGIEGTVKLGSNAIAEVRSWSIEEQGDTSDSTTFDNAANANGGKWRTHKHTLSGWSGNVECFWDETDTNGQNALTIGASVTLNVYAEGDSTGDIYYSGTATVTSISRSASVDGLVEASFSFQGNGALTQSTVS